MRPLLATLFALSPGLALAHPGHFAEVAGHDHVLAGVAIAVAVGVAVWGALKGGADEGDEAESEDATADAADLPDEEPQGA